MIVGVGAQDMATHDFARAFLLLSTAVELCTPAQALVVIRTYPEGEPHISRLVTSSHRLEETVRVNITKGIAGCAPAVTNGAEVDFFYAGSLDPTSATGAAGNYFFSGQSEPLTATMGSGQLIGALDAGLIGLCEMDHATIIAPPELAYGQYGAGLGVPPGATIRLEIEIHALRPPRLRTLPAPDVFRQIDSDNDGSLDEQEVDEHFARLGKPVPPALWRTEDKDKDRRISWSEFGGPKLRRVSQPSSR